jgi:hypothetical protein
MNNSTLKFNSPDATFKDNISNLLSDKFHDSKLSYSLGVQAKKEFKSRIYIYAGFIYQNGGINTKIDEITDEQPQGTGNFINYSYNINSLIIPVNIGYYIANKQKTKYGIDIGLTQGILINKYEKPNLEIINKEFKPYNIGALLRFVMVKQINDQYSFSFSPYYLKELNKHNSNYTQMSLGLQFGAFKFI